MLEVGLVIFPVSFLGFDGVGTPAGDGGVCVGVCEDECPKKNSVMAPSESADAPTVLNMINL